VIPYENVNKLLCRTCSNWEDLDKISYATATTVNILDPSTIPLHGVLSHHLEYHEWRSIFPFEKPTQMGWNHQIMSTLGTLFQEGGEPQGEREG
jgi:hypothetical protein